MREIEVTNSTNYSHSDISSSAYCYQIPSNDLIPANGKRSGLGARVSGFTFNYTCNNGYEYNDPVSVAANASSEAEDDFLLTQRRVQCKERAEPEFGAQWEWLDGGPPNPCYREWNQFNI